MPLLVEDTDEQMKHSFDKWSFAAGLGLGALVFTAVGREMLKTAIDLPEHEIRERIDKVRAERGLPPIYRAERVLPRIYR